MNLKDGCPKCYEHNVKFVEIHGEGKLCEACGRAEANGPDEPPPGYRYRYTRDEEAATRKRAAAAAAGQRKRAKTRSSAVPPVAVPVSRVKVLFEGCGWCPGTITMFDRDDDTYLIVFDQPDGNDYWLPLDADLKFI